MTDEAPKKPRRRKPKPPEQPQEGAEVIELRPDPPAEDAGVAEEATAEPVDGLFVVKVRDPETGNIDVDIHLNGGLQATEVYTILGMAKKKWAKLTDLD